ncbi:hypothetical protein HZB00_01055 [Candidatus Woesearchaeota archaeon]|nr:hypothetical protein [Candidatus Woesearchaeota archaeon]
MKSKKGAVGLESVLWLIRFFFVLVIAIFFYIVLIAYKTESFHTTSIENEILLRNILSPACIGEENQRPGIIDVQKLTDIQLRNCFQKENTFYKIALKTNQEEILQQAKSMPDEIEQLLPICASIPQFSCSKKQLYVLYASSKERKPAILDLEVVNRVE